MQTQREKRVSREELLDLFLKAFLEAGTLDLSLDQLAARVGISKRMLIHYFGSRETIEMGAIARLEDKLRGQFAPGNFRAGTSGKDVVMALWKRTTSTASKPVLLLIMDISRRAWRGSERARDFYDEQQRLWVGLLRKFIPEKRKVEEVLQVFQGATLAYLITGDPKPGRRTLVSVVGSRHKNKRRSRQLK
jgi:AcrR family transcriptional regulator